MDEGDVYLRVYKRTTKPHMWEKCQQCDFSLMMAKCPQKGQSEIEVPKPIKMQHFQCRCRRMILRTSTVLVVSMNSTIIAVTAHVPRSDVIMLIASDRQPLFKNRRNLLSLFFLRSKQMIVKNAVNHSLTFSSRPVATKCFLLSLLFLKWYV